MRSFHQTPVSRSVLVFLLGATTSVAAAAPSSYRERVERFWDWWGENAGRIYESVDEDGGRSIQPEVSKAVDDLGVGFGWAFGPGADGEGHSLTITPEGDPVKRPLVDFWHAKAPEIPNWTFYPARQPSSSGVDGTEIVMGDLSVAADELWITPEVDVEGERIDITAWSPPFDEIGRDDAARVLFIMLDAALGERGTSDWLRGIEIGAGKSDGSIPLPELPAFIDETYEKHGWEKMQSVAEVYRIDEPIGDFPRGDMFIGSTSCFSLVSDYLDAEGPFELALTEAGVRFVFVQLPMGVLGEGDPVEARGKIGDKLDDNLAAAGAGGTLGGALGRKFCYIDLVIFDPKRGSKIVADTLAGLGLEKKYRVRSFTK